MPWLLAVLLVALDASTLQVAGAVAVAAVTAGVTYLVARRSTSGSISTTSADTLWGAAEAIRREQGEEIVRLRVVNDGLRERIAVLEDQRKEDRVRIMALEDEVRRLHS